MITRIGYNLENKNFTKKYYVTNTQTRNNNFNQNVSEFNLPYFVPSFTAKSDKHTQTKFDEIMYNANTPAKNLINELEKEAKETGYGEITTMHVIRHGLNDLCKYIEDLDSGKKDFDAELQPSLGLYLSSETTPLLLSKQELRDKIKPILKEYIQLADDILLNEKTPERTKTKKTILSQDLTDSIWAFSKATEIDAVEPYTIFCSALTSPDDVTNEFNNNLIYDLSNKVMINDKSMKQRSPFSEYEKKAENVLKNLSLGTNIFLTYDMSKDNVNNFLDTIKKVNDKQNKFTFIEFNSNTKSEHYANVINKLAKNKSKNYIVALPPMAVMYNDADPEDVEKGQYPMLPALTGSLFNQPSNVKFLFYDTKNNYYAIGNGSQIFDSFEEASIPSLSTAQMIKSFKENPNLMEEVPRPFSKKAIEKTVEVSAQLDGVFPDKTQKLMKKIASYYINKKEISEKDVSNYLKEATNLFKKNNDDTSIDVIFDTGKKLKDFVGKTATQKEAGAIAKQLKSNKMGTKGIIVYSQDGSPGCGRKFTAKAIAGEARVPYVEMNTMDFGTKEVDLFGAGALSPEASIKKLFSLVTTQAEANPHKSAVLFIENFEYFSVGEFVSQYHQKAMSQLLREMDKADKMGLNILVVGSVADPRLIGEAAMKSFKFIDKVAVTSPAYNKEERAAVLKYAIKKEKLKIEGNQEKQNELVDYVSDISEGFPFIYLKNLVKKAHNVAIENGHKFLDKKDFTEAYLQITTGRPASSKIEEHEKNIVTSHECGHATNLEVMNNLAKTMGEKWHIPDKVNFITLDPRGYYGGAVYHGEDINSEYTFEKMFANIVTSFGGNSAEDVFYNIPGSYGISSDMEHVRATAETMVKVMGLGANTGKMAIDDNENLSEKMKEKIENDESVIINNAKIVSDLITEIYADFNREFTQEYAHLVGTGNCMVNGSDFRKSLQEWKAKQSPEKQQELKLCDETILKIIDCTKKGLPVQKESR